MKKLFFLIGSSGAGKTTVAKSIEAMNLANLVVCYSDSIRVPPIENMIKEYGSQEEWQRINTDQWVKKIKEKYLNNKDVLFDTQSRPSFIDEACQNSVITAYEIILLDCSDDERKRRLVKERNQPELSTDQMMDWAKYLRERCVGKNQTILNNTNYTQKQSLERLLEIMGRTQPEKPK